MTSGTIEQLNGCLRGEISAAETYKMAIDRLSGAERPAEVARLHDLQREHGMAARQLRERIVALGGAAADGSGAWGAFAKTVQGTADLFGDAAALKSLKEGEEYGLNEYEQLLTDAGDLDPLSQSLVGRLAAQQRRHVAEIDSLMATV